LFSILYGREKLYWQIIDTESSVELNTEEEAKQFYAQVKEKLGNVNNWHQVAGALSATFQLVDENGVEIKRTVQQGDHFKIDIPGPGTQSGEGYDWVKVEEVKEVNEDSIQSFGIRVRPCSNPLNEKKDVAHFYSDSSTSNFIVTREGKKVTASVYDRNTKPNDAADSTIDTIRDKIVGATAVSFFSKVQWKGLVDGLLKPGY
jgi:hypothetical protein